MARPGFQWNRLWISFSGRICILDVKGSQRLNGDVLLGVVHWVLHVLNRQKIGVFPFLLGAPGLTTRSKDATSNKNFNACFYM